MSDNSSSKKEILVCFLIDSRLHLTTQLYRSTVPLVASMVHNIPERDDVKWRVVCADRRDERNAAFFDPDATSGLRGSKLYCLSVLEFLKTFSNIPANDDESKSQQISQWHQALQGQNNSLITKEIDVAETENLAAIITRLPRQSHEFSVHFDDLIKQREKKFSQKFLVVNNPLGAELCGSKQFLLNLRKWCPVLEQVSSKEEIEAFYEKHKQSGIVLKPLNSSGGKGIIKIDSNGKVWLGVQEPDFQSLEAFLNSDCPDLNPVAFIAMKYLKNVKEGDKRIIVIDGEIIGASLRKPTGESWLCNASQGGTSHASFVSDFEKEMVKDVSKIVSEYGVLFIGLDTLVDDDGQRILSEVNCVTIGGMNPLQSVSGKPILKMTAEALWHSITKRCL